MGGPGSGKRKPREHGTVRGFRQHHTDGTVACRPCCRANAVYQRALWTHGRCAPGLGWPLQDPPLPGTACPPAGR